MRERRPLILLCPPDHYEVAYRINPWMDPKAWAPEAAALRAEAQAQWGELRSALGRLGARILLIDPEPGVPDMVFTANAGVVLDGKGLLARFRHPERQAEEPHFEAYFERLLARGMLASVHRLPEGIVHEGAGDALYDEARGVLWTGHGQRSDAAAAPVLSALFDVETVPLRLASPRFYHLDTCFCPLPQGHVLYHPPAFAPEALDEIERRVPAGRRIAAGAEDAEGLGVNAVALGETLVMAACSRPLEAALERAGYGVMRVPLTAFTRSGGAAFCLTLRLDRQTAPALAHA